MSWLSERLHLAHRTLGHQRANQVELALRQVDLPLDRLGALHQFVAARLEQLAFGTRQRPLGIDVRRELDALLAEHLGVEPGNGRAQHAGLVRRLLEVGEEARLVEAHQRLADFHQVALLHQQAVEDAALQALDLLDATERHDPAVAAGHLVQLRPGRPADEQQHATEQGPEQRPVDRVGSRQQRVGQLPAQGGGVAFRVHGCLLRRPAVPVPGCPAPPAPAGRP